MGAQRLAAAKHLLPQAIEDELHARKDEVGCPQLLPSFLSGCCESMRVWVAPARRCTAGTS